MLIHTVLEPLERQSPLLLKNVICAKERHLTIETLSGIMLSARVFGERLALEALWSTIWTETIGAGLSFSVGHHF